MLPSLSSFNIFTPAVWLGRAAKNWENQWNVMWVEYFANVTNSNAEKAVLVLTINCKFDHAKLGRCAGGECAEGGDKVWYGKNAMEMTWFVIFDPVEAANTRKQPQHRPATARCSVAQLTLSTSCCCWLRLQNTKYNVKENEQPHDLWQQWVALPLTEADAAVVWGLQYDWVCHGVMMMMMTTGVFA